MIIYRESRPLPNGIEQHNFVALTSLNSQVHVWGRARLRYRACVLSEILCYTILLAFRNAEG